MDHAMANEAKPRKMCSTEVYQIPTPYQAVYLINNQPLQVMDQYTYLGVKLHSLMTWSHHIQAIVNKATKKLNFVKRALYQCDAKVKATAYSTLV